MKPSGDASTGRRIAQIRGDRSRLEFARVMNVHKNTLARYEFGENSANAEFLARLLSQGYNINWVLSGEGPQQIAGSGCGPQTSNSVREDSSSYASPRGRGATVVDTETLAEVFEALCTYQHDRRIRWQARDAARIAAEIYQYLMEQDQPTAEDRARAIRLVTSVIEGIHERTDTGEGGT